MIGANIDLRAGGTLHGELVSEIDKRQKHSEQKMGNRYQNWRDMDDAQVAFVKPREVDRIRKEAKRNDGVIDYIQVEVPYSYGMMMSAHTYWSSVFLNRDPVFQVMARHGEPQHSVLAMEALLDYQNSVGRMNSNLYIWLYDACKYGVGIVGRYWDEEQKIISEITEEDVLFLGEPTGQKKRYAEPVPLKGIRATACSMSDLINSSTIPELPTRGFSMVNTVGMRLRWLGMILSWVSVKVGTSTYRL